MTSTFTVAPRRILNAATSPARRGQRRKGADLIDDILTSFPEPFPVTRREVEEAAYIVVANLRLSPRDAIHAAVCVTYGLEGIVSADRAFDGLPGVTRFDPLKIAGER